MIVLRTLKTAILAGVAMGPLVLCANAQTAPAADRGEVIIVTGTRVAERSVLDTAVAVDVLPVEDLEKGGVSEINQALSVSLPSFNFPRPALNDGTDTIRPATLRGLAPDQTLVLVNSKRRHALCAGQRQRLDRPRLVRRRPEHHPHRRDRRHRSAARRRLGPVRIGRHRRRHQRPPARSANSGGSVSASYGYRDTTYTVPTNPPPAGLPITVARRDRARP